MASAQNSSQSPQTNVVHHNHIMIKYQQPPDPAIINYVLEIFIEVTRSFSQKNPAQVPYYPRTIFNQIIPLLQTLYSQSAQQVQGRVPPPVSNTTYLPPAYKSLQKLLSELNNAQTSSLGMMAHLQF